MASGIHRGWKFDKANGRLAVQYDSTEVFDFDANDFAVALASTFGSTVAVTGALSANGGLSVVGATTMQLPSGACCALQTGSLGVVCVTCVLHVTFTPC